MVLDRAGWRGGGRVCVCVVCRGPLSMGTHADAPRRQVRPCACGPAAAQGVGVGSAPATRSSAPRSKRRDGERRECKRGEGRGEEREPRPATAVFFLSCCSGAALHKKPRTRRAHTLALPYLAHTPPLSNCLNNAVGRVACVCVAIKGEREGRALSSLAMGRPRATRGVCVDPANCPRPRPAGTPPDTSSARAIPLTSSTQGGCGAAVW